MIDKAITKKIINKLTTIYDKIKLGKTLTKTEKDLACSLIICAKEDLEKELNNDTRSIERKEKNK